MLALACEPAQALVPSEPALASVRFTPGEVASYRFEWAIDSEVPVAALPVDFGLIAGVRLSGALELRVLAPSRDVTVLAVTLRELDRHEITLMGSNAIDDPGELVGHTCWAVLDDQGTVRELAFSHDASPLLRHVVSGLFTQIDLHSPATEAATVVGGSGLADVTYERVSPHRIVRTLQGYARFDAVATETLPEASGELTMVLDERERTTRIEAHETVAAGDEADTFGARTRFVLERRSVSIEPVVTSPELAELIRIDPSAAPNEDEARRLLAQRFAEELDAADVAMAVHVAAAGMRPEPDFIVQATGRLRGWPELAVDLRPLFDTYEDPRSRSLVVDMLASAGTPEAQRLLVELLGRDELREHPSYRAWLQRFAFLWRPQPSTAKFLLARLEAARRDHRDDERRAIAYPLGTVARRIGEIDPITGAALRGRLREELAAAKMPQDVVAALGGLGNAGATADEALVISHIDDADADVRATVAIALRHHADAPALAALHALASDRDAFVAATARSVLERRS
ncbi:MAG TPA: hypothetical protein VG755_08060 [Nannocystaceae bacterium]|nr:hypothetical protein [Nannocystaceae bacterium]